MYYFSFGILRILPTIQPTIFDTSVDHSRTFYDVFYSRIGFNSIITLLTIWQRSHLHRPPFTFDCLINLPQFPGELINLQYVNYSPQNVTNMLTEVIWHLDGVLQRLSQKVVIVRHLEIQISRMQRTLDLFLCMLCTRSFAVCHTNGAVKYLSRAALYLKVMHSIKENF